MLHISDGERIGYLVLSVTIRKESTEMISTLRDCGVQSVLLTGDNENSANSIAKQLGISEVYPVLQCVAFAGPAGPAFLVCRKPLARRVVPKKACADDEDRKTPFVVK